jgi:hypothetical protein
LDEKYQGWNKTVAAGKKLREGSKPDFLDLDKDGNKTEPMKKAAKDKELGEADYSAKKAAAGKDIGKPGKAFAQIAKDAAGRYGSKEKGEKVAGAVLAKLRAKEDVNEADVEEGNEFSGALARAKASGATEFEVDGKKYKVTTEGFKELDAYMDRKKKEQGTGKFDKKQISTGTVYTRRYEEEPDDDSDAPVSRGGAPKKKGRKEVGTGKGKKIGAKSRGTSKLASKDSIKEGTPPDLVTAEIVRDTAYMLGSLVARSKRGETIPSKELTIQLSQISKAMSQILGRLQQSEPMTEDSTMNMVVQATGHAADLINRIQQNGQVEPKELMTKLRAIHSTLSKIQGGAPVDTLRPETKPMAEDNSIPLVDKGEYDREGDMAKEQLHTIELAAEELASILSDDENLPEWVQSKITKAMDYVDTARDYMIATKDDRNHDVMAEKAVSKNQAVSARIARAVQKGEAKAEPGTASAEMAKMQPKELKKFAKTDTKDLPKKVKEADAEPKAKKTGGIEFGKGVYESINSRVEKMITEGMNVSVNMSTNEHGELTKNITVSAEGDEAESLAQLLNLAGMKSSSCDCGQSPCGCSQMEESYGDTTPTENAPDYPTDEETTGEDDELLRRWAGGLNKPKSTGQTTIPVIASQTDRQVSEQAVADKLGMNLYAELKQFKAR